LSLKTKVDDLSVVWSQNHYDGFSLVWVSKPMATVCEWFGIKTTQIVFAGLVSKPVVMISGGLTLKPVAMVSSGFDSKPAVMVFSRLTAKLVAMSFLVEHQNQGGGRFFWFGPQNRQLRFGDFGFKITATVS
jgi:hypothetical protein